MDTTATIARLEGLRSKAKAMSVLFGLGVTLASLSGALLGVVMLDYLLNLQAWPRLFFILASAGGLGYLAWRWVIRSAMARVTLSDMAGRVEELYPQLNDRLRSSVSFGSSEVPGSRMMQERTIAEANRLAQELDFGKVIDRSPVVKSLAAGFGTIIVLFLLGAVAGEYTGVAFNRLANPFGKNPWPKVYRIDAEKLPSRVLFGQRMNVSMRLAKGDHAKATAILYYQYDDGTVQKEVMRRSDDGTFTAAIEARGGKVAVWMKSGDDQTARIEVPVIERLAINRVDALVTPPVYTGLGRYERNLSESPMTVTLGSEVQCSIAFNKRVSRSHPIVIESVKPEIKLPQFTWDMSRPDRPVASFRAMESIRFRVKATDEDSFQSAGAEEFEITVRPDAMPSVAIENPRRNEDRTAIAAFPVDVMAEDDFGVKTMTLVVDRLGEAKKHIEIPLAGWSLADGTPDRQRFGLRYVWDLKAFQAQTQTPLNVGDVLEYFVTVTDSFSLDGQTHPAVTSGKLRITIISQEDLDAQIAEKVRNVAEKVATVQNIQDRTAQQTRDFRQEVRERKELDTADKAGLNRLIDTQATASSQTKQATSQLEELDKRMKENRSENAELQSTVNDAKKQLDSAAENPMKESSKQLNNASQPSGDPKNAPKERDKALDDAQKNQKAASDELQKALDRMANLGSLQQMISAVKQQLKDQEKARQDFAKLGKDNLGKKPEEMSKNDQNELKKIADEQNKLAEKQEKLDENLEKMGQQMSKSDPSASEAMKSAAQQSKQSQVAQQQKQASQSAQQNQQSQTQQSQQQAELGLQQMLSTLQEAERKKLEELARKLADMQKKLGELIVRQANHNVDNLVTQGGEILKEITKELLAKALKEKAPEQAVEPFQQANSQGQTERTTRDLSQELERLPKGAEAGASLAKAAGKMERAAITLGDKKLPEAYNPSQVDALKLLESARELVDALKKEVDDKKQEAKQAALREEFIKLRDDQAKLNGETLRVDKVVVGANGKLSRVDDAARRHLPGEQNTLADRGKELGQKLVDLGSVVYTWANRDIVDTMISVKGDLEKPDTGAGVQTEQIRIVEQLDAMIRNLAEAPKDPEKFNKPPGGGGGGGGGGSPKPKLPTDVELRLLKDLQLAVNRSTKVMADLGQKEKPKYIALGGRQGSLRKLLNDTLEKASKGEIKLRPEPDASQQLPEESTTGEIENQELEQELLAGKPVEDQAIEQIMLAGDRMSRSKVRLADKQDPGKTTQKIQDRIVVAMDLLIKAAQQQQQQQSSSSSSSSSQSQAQSSGAKPQNSGEQPGGESKPNNGKSGAQQSTLTQADENNADLSKEIRETLAEWGKLTPREREAIREGANETVVQKYKTLTDQYFRSLAEKASQKR